MWIKRLFNFLLSHPNYLAIYAGIGFVISGTVWLIPPSPHEQPYPIQFAWHTLAPILLLGFLLILLIPIYGMFFLQTKMHRFVVHIPIETDDRLILLLLVLIVGVSVSFLLWRLLRITKIRKFLVLLLFVNHLLGLVFFLPLMVLGPGNYHFSLKRSCIVNVGEQTAIRVDYFNSSREEDMRLAHIPVFRETSYQITHDGGESWREFAHLVPWAGGCEQNGKLSETFFWLWEAGTLFVTHDGGENWQVWDVQELGGEFAGIPDYSAKTDSYIDDVSFENKGNGRMQISWFDHATQTRPSLELYTTDGGLTWFMH